MWSESTWWREKRWFSYFSNDMYTHQLCTCLCQSEVGWLGTQKQRCQGLHRYLCRQKFQFDIFGEKNFQFNMFWLTRSPQESRPIEGGTSLQSARFNKTERTRFSFISSVRSSYSHPDLLLTQQQQHHPLFQITPVLNTGLSLSEPLELYKGYHAI